MTFTPEQTRELDAPLHKSHVKTREQGGKNLSYVEAWWAISEANRIFGFDAWARETILLQETNRELVELQGKNGPYKQWRVGYLAKVRISVAGIVREGTGFGSGMAKPDALGDAIESAAKEAESDAMKRALMTFGNPFGLALYDKTQANVVAEEAPREAKRADPKPPTLSERADRLEATLKEVKPDQVEKAWALGSGLLADLSVDAPERLAELTKLYEFRKPAAERAAA